MRKRRLIALVMLCAAIAAASLISTRHTSAQQIPTPYNPYPPGILPADLTTEIARVQREIQFIFNQALGEMNALPPPTLTSNPPTLQGSGYQAVQTLGKLMNFDLNMSPLRNEACAFCHMPYAGYSGPIPSVNLTMVAYPGTFEFRAGKRTAQRYTYSPRYPVLELYPDQNLLFGGNFWDGRSTGFLLQSPDAEQAQHPPVDTQEHALPDTACIAWRISEAVYRPLFELVWGADFDINWPSNTEQICSTPGGRFPSAPPVTLSAVDRTKATNIYDHWAQSISCLDHTPELSPFTSKCDGSQVSPSCYTLTA